MEQLRAQRDASLIKPERYVGYLEAHIEQGDVLEASSKRIGVYQHGAYRAPFLDSLSDYLRHPSISAENVGIAEVGSLLLDMLTGPQ
ncbi:hypothetical protein [Mesorhizobium sp. M0618]|uniref:hypothetical protein n=1 Tax=unclassified Mesorhizobium TaxID=325217 RepID=UPI00333A5798